MKINYIFSILNGQSSQYIHSHTPTHNYSIYINNTQYILHTSNNIPKTKWQITNRKTRQDWKARQTGFSQMNTQIGWSKKTQKKKQHVHWKPDKNMTRIQKCIHTTEPDFECTVKYNHPQLNRGINDQQLNFLRHHNCVLQRELELRPTNMWKLRIMQQMK
jgi:hypothetical protein